MKLIVISPEETVPHEIETVHALFNEGLKIFHLRKPNFSETDFRTYLNLINNRFLDRIMIHSHHNLQSEYQLRGKHYNSSSSIIPQESSKKMSKSCHTITEIQKNSSQYEYVFLSPIFNSISKSNYFSDFENNELKNMNPIHSNVIALGGINQKNTQIAKTLKFSGVAILGDIWMKKNTTKRTQIFISIREEI